MIKDNDEKNARCEILGKRRRGRPNLRWKDARERDMSEEGLNADSVTNRAEWRKKIIS